MISLIMPKTNYNASFPEKIDLESTLTHKKAPRGRSSALYEDGLFKVPVFLVSFIGCGRLAQPAQKKGRPPQGPACEILLVLRLT